MRRGHVGSPRQWLCFLMLLGMWVQALVKHFVQTSHLVINNWYFRSILNVGFAGLSPANVSYPSWAVWWCRWGWPWGQRESERPPITVSYNIPSLHLFCIGHLFASQTPAHILVSSFKGPAPENCKLELRKQVSSLPGAYLICKRQTCWEMPFKVNSWNFITCAGLWTSPGQPLLGCWIGHCGAAARLPAQADPLLLPCRAGATSGAVCMDDTPALTTQTTLYGLSEHLTAAAMSRSGSAVAQGGVATPAEHPRAVRSPAWESVDAGEGGSQVRATEMPSDSVSAM